MTLTAFAKKVLVVPFKQRRLEISASIRIFCQKKVIDESNSARTSRPDHKEQTIENAPPIYHSGSIMIEAGDISSSKDPATMPVLLRDSIHLLIYISIKKENDPGNYRWTLMEAPNGDTGVKSPNLERRESMAWSKFIACPLPRPAGMFLPLIRREHGQRLLISVNDSWGESELPETGRAFPLHSTNARLARSGSCLHTARLSPAEPKQSHVYLRPCDIR